MDIVHDCTPCIILTVVILQIMQNYYSPRKLDFVFSKIDNYNSKALLECPVVQKVDSALKSAG